MVKYLIKKNNTFWYRRKIQAFGEIVFSLKTKSYDIALVRHSYIDFKIKKLIYKGIFETMTVQEIRNIIEKYKLYMINEEYNDFEEQRDKELTITLNGKEYGGHTKEALNQEIKRYQVIHEQNNLDLIKEETSKILNRCNLTNDDLSKLETDKDKMIFHWELFKVEWELLHKSYEEQKEVVQTTDEPINAEMIYAYQEFCKSKSIENKETDDRLSISELTKMYISENKNAKDWSDKNERDIKYVLNHFANYYPDKKINDLKRGNFSQFRDNVIKNLPLRSTKLIFRGKSTSEIIQIVKNENHDKIGITSINKHLRRIHQVFEWASNCGYIDKNLTKDLKLTDKKKSKKQKTAKIPYTDDELKLIFEQSSWFTDKINFELKNNPEHIFIPLLAIFTGAKPTELATLKLQSIKIQNNIIGIDFNKMIKTTDSERFTPISQVLIDIGFLKYINYQKRYKEKLLFPQIRIYKDGNTRFTNDYNKYNRDYITQEKDKTFYSFRHLVNQKLKNKKTHPYIINDITGHSHTNGDKDQEVYGSEQMPEEILKNTINECLVYDINFTRIKEAIEIAF